MSQLTPRELEIIKAASRSAVEEMHHVCHFPEEERKGIHRIVDPDKNRVERLVEIADAANLTGIKSDGHAVIFTVGKQVTIIGEKAVGAVIISVLILTLVGLFLLFGWKPLIALFSQLK